MFTFRVRLQPTWPSDAFHGPRVDFFHACNLMYFFGMIPLVDTDINQIIDPNLASGTV